MRRSTTLMTILAAGLLMAGTALARGPGRGLGGPPHEGWGMGPCGGGFGPRMATMLDLTEAQRGQIDKLRQTMEQQTAEARVALFGNRDELHALWTQDDPQRDEILAKQAEMDVYRQALREAMVDFRLAMHAVLTTEQRAKVKAMGPMGRGRRGPPGDDGPCWDHD